MKLIYTQETVNLFITAGRIGEIESMGTPKPVELLEENGEVKTRYFLYDDSINSSEKS
jgi:hypothetical protein